MSEVPANGPIGTNPEAASQTAAKTRIGAWVVVEASGATKLLQMSAVRQPYVVLPRSQDRLLVARVEPGARLVVGRSREADLSLSFDPTVSSVHASMERHLDLLTVEDLGPSTNGTFVNGQKITGRVRLSDRDLVRFASTEVLVRCPVMDDAGRTIAMPPAIDWSRLTPTERRVVATLLELWPPEARLQRAPTTAQLGTALALGAETVRTHLKSIYAKLRDFGVEPSREALAEAATESALDLLEAGIARPEVE
ncbi:MAG: FHA domain-containing protein [Patulibacter minatonensis]